MSTIPRLSQDELPPELAALLRPRIERLGYLGEFFKCAAHQPAALMSFMAFSEDLKHALPHRLIETVALTVTTELENLYERNQHERLCLKLGFGDAWIRSIEDRDPTRVKFLSAAERAAQTLTLAVVRRHGKDAAGDLDALAAVVGHAQAIAVLMLVGRYVTHSLMVNALDLKPPVPSPL
jgi:alkylhydroperoxidase family enzyme